MTPPIRRRSLLSIVLALSAVGAQAATDQAIEKELLCALHPVKGARALEQAGQAIRDYKAARVLPAKPWRMDYMDYYAARKPATFMGNELAIVVEEYMLAYVGCCVNPGAGVYVRVTTDTRAMEAYASANKCSFDGSIAVKDLPAWRGRPAMPPGRYASLVCQDDDLSTE